MDEVVRSLLIGIGTVLAAVLAAIAVQIRGRADTAKDTLAIKNEADRQRIKSESAFQQAFIDIKRDFDEERRKNDHLDKRINELIEFRIEDAGKLADLQGQIQQLKLDATTTAEKTAALIRQLEEKLLQRTNERDEALAKVITLNGEVHKRDEQIAHLQAALDEMKAAQALMQEQIKSLQKKDTGPLSPDAVPDHDPAPHVVINVNPPASTTTTMDSKAQTAIDAITAAQADMLPTNGGDTAEKSSDTDAK